MSLEEINTTQKQLSEVNSELEAENERLKARIAELEANSQDFLTSEQESQEEESELESQDFLTCQQQSPEEESKPQVIEQIEQVLDEKEKLAQEFWEIIENDSKSWIRGLRNSVPVDRFLGITPEKDPELCYQALRRISEKGKIELLYYKEKDSTQPWVYGVPGRYFIFSNLEQHQCYCSSRQIDTILEQLNSIIYDDSKGLVSEHLGCIPLSELREHIYGTRLQQNIALLALRNQGIISLKFGHSNDPNCIFTADGKEWFFVQVEQLIFSQNHHSSFTFSGENSHSRNH